MKGFLWCIGMSVGHSQVRARKGTCGMASLITLVHMAACSWRFLVLHPFPILSGHLFLSYPLFCLAQFWFLSILAPVLQGSPGWFTEARLLWSLHLLPWATCAHPVLTVRLDKTSHSFRCSHWPPVPSVRNLLAILDFFCSRVHYFLLTYPHNH